MLNYTESDILGQHFSRFVYPADEKKSAEELKKRINGEGNFKFENRFITKTGEIIWLAWNYNSSREEGIIFASAKNITKEKKLGELLDDATALARIGSWEIDLLQQNLYWSYMVHEMHGTDAADFTPSLTDGIAFYREDYRKMVQAAIQHTINTGEHFDFEAIIITTNKEELWVRVIGKAEMLDGKCIRIIGSFQDIHDRKSVELRLHSIMDDLPGASFQYIQYPDGRKEMRSISKAAEKSGALHGKNA